MRQILRRRPLLVPTGGLLFLAALAGLLTVAFSGPTADPVRVGLAMRVGADSTLVDSLATLDPDRLDPVSAAALRTSRLGTEAAVWLDGERIVLHPEVAPFYRARDLIRVWTDRTSRDTVLHTIRRSDLDGLDPESYRLGALTAAVRALDARDPREDRPEADTLAADLDLALTDALFRLADDLAGARTDPEALYGAMWMDARTPRAIPNELTEALSDSDRLGAWLDSLAPPHAGYRHLRDALARQIAGTGPDSVSADLLRLNMERWRWLPRDLGERHVVVNVPSYHLWIREDGRDVFDMKVVVGKPGRWQTPVFTDTMETIVFSPPWILPASIQREQYGRVIPGRTQPPGPGNAMGRAKFMFPNDHFVYIHDTNAKRGFRRTYRALSHGCVRAADPRDFATALLTRTNGWDAEEVDSRFSGPWRTETVEVEGVLPVHLLYFTAWPDADGTVHLPADVYRRDAILADALGLTL
ncbi:MAG: L,D-transpeptidase family protein [Bacteroidota bacterium]